MVNGTTTLANATRDSLHPFGDLDPIARLSARLARALRGVFEPLLRAPVATVAEPIAARRFADYAADRAGVLTGWLPLAMTTGDAGAIAVFDGGFVLTALDLFFGGSGARPKLPPAEFSPAAEAMIARLGTMIAAPLAAAWEPLAPVGFTAGRPESAPAMLRGIAGEDAVIVTRFAITAGDAGAVFVDLLYPVAALKPFAAVLTGTAPARGPRDPQWRSALTRAAMSVRLPVRSVLAEPVIPLATLVELGVGDVIPISFGADVPVLVGGDRFGTGTVGAANGRAAIQITRVDRVDEEDDR